MKNIAIITTVSLIAIVLYVIAMYSPFNDYVFTSSLKAILFLFCPLVYFRSRFKEMFIKGNKKQIKRSLGLGVGIIATIFALFAVMRLFLDHEMIIAQMDGYGIGGNNFMFVFIYIVVINATLEEVFFRGFIFRTIYNMNYKRYAHIYSSLVFSLYHIPMLVGGVSPGILIFLLFGLVVAGLIFNYIVIKCENIIGAIIVHIAANMAINLIVVYYLYYLPLGRVH